MISWYEDNYIGIKFSERPCVSMRYALPSMTSAEIANIKKYPFLNRKDLKVQLDDYFAEKTYSFTIPKGYCWDGATIPRVFWRLIGSKTDSAFLIPSLIHDVLCENHNYVDNDRYFADKVFECLLKVSEVPAFNRWIMFHSVEAYQKVNGKWEKQK